MNLLAVHFCNPPINDKQEIENLFHVDDRVEKQNTIESIDNSIEVSVWVDHISEKWGKSKFRFHISDQGWYEYSEEKFFWLPIYETIMQFHICKGFENYQKSNSLRRTTFMNNFTRLFALYVLVDDNEIRSIQGISFMNGFLHLNKMKLESHSSERFTTTTPPTPLMNQKKWTVNTKDSWQSFVPITLNIFII
jgi:hypothetical protein